MADPEIPAVTPNPDETALDKAAGAVVDYTLGAEVYDTFADFQRAHWRKALAAAAPYLTAALRDEVDRLRTERDAWKAHTTHLESRLFDIWVLTERPARKLNDLQHDDVCTVAELADAPSGPAVLADPPATALRGEA